MQVGYERCNGIYRPHPRKVEIAHRDDVMREKQWNSPISRMGCGGYENVGTAQPVTPLTIMGANCLHWWRADLGNTIATDGNWVDQVSGLVLAQATTGSRPAQSSNGGPNGIAMMQLDGSNDSLAVNLVRAAPGTTPAVIWFVFRQDSWTLNDSLFNDGSATFAVQQVTSTPQLRLFAGGTAGGLNGAGTIGSWFRGQALFTNSVNDEMLIGATAVNPAASSGNTAGTQFLIGRNSGSTTFSAYSLTEVALFDAKPSAGQKASLDGYVTNLCGAGLV